MASRSIFSNLKSNGGDKLADARWGRLLSSVTSRVKKARVRSAAAASNESLKGRILGLRSPTESATEVLRSWIDSGQKVDTPQLLSITQNLHSSRRYNQALQVPFFISSSEFVDIAILKKTSFFLIGRELFPGKSVFY